MYRCLEKMDLVEFNKDLNGNLTALSPTNKIVVKMGNYNTVLTEVINKHAPIKNKQIKVVPEAPWFDAEYADLRKLRRRAEKKYKKTGLEADKNLYVTLRKQAINTSFENKKMFITNKLEQ